MNRLMTTKNNSVNSENVVKESESILTNRINEYLANDDLIAAYPLLKKLSIEIDRSSPTCNLAGLVAAKLNRYGEARTHFSESLSNDSENYDALYNLAFLEMVTGNLGESIRQFKRLVRKFPTDPTLYNDLGAAYSQSRQTARALGCYLRAIKIDSNFSIARNNALEHCLEQNIPDTAANILERNEQKTDLTPLSKAEIKRWREILFASEKDRDDSLGSAQALAIDSNQVIKGNNGDKKRLAFFANHQSFVTAIQAGLSSEYEIRVYDRRGQDSMNDLLDWADLAWFEWCDDLVIQASALPKRCKILCRLHSYEAFTEMPDQVNWQNVDHLLFVNDSVKQLVASRLPAGLEQSVIYNGVDLEKFRIPNGKQTSKKIASVGYINYKKNPTLLLYCFKMLHEIDSEYSLHIAGTHQDSRIALYFEHFLKQYPLPVYFDGWVEDMPAWYADKGWVISTSLFESFHYSIAEGMSSGLLPLIHNWYGAENLYPIEYLFGDPADLTALVKKLESKDYSQTIEVNRKYIADRFDLSRTMPQIRTLLASITASVPIETSPASIR